MKKTLFFVVISSLAVLMLLPVSASVNTTAGKLQLHGATFVADGSPMPPYPPQAKAASPVLIADGSPMPPYPPQSKPATPVIIADGSPMPPYPPQVETVSPVLSADGSPMPPYPPQFNTTMNA